MPNITIVKILNSLRAAIERIGGSYRRLRAGVAVDAGIVSIEYLATTLVAAAIVGVMVIVPTDAAPNVKTGFDTAVCKIFGGDCEAGPGSNPEAAEADKPLAEQPPVCTVSTSTEKGSVSVNIRIVTAEGEYVIQKTTKSDGTIDYEVVAGGSLGVDVSTPSEGAKAGVEGKVKLNLGDRWTYDPKDPQGYDSPAALEQAIRENAGWIAADKVTSGAASSAGEFFGVKGEGPRDADYSSKELELSGSAYVEAGDTLGVSEDLEAKAKAKVGASGSAKITTNNKTGAYTVDVALSAEASAEVYAYAVAEGEKAGAGAQAKVKGKDNVQLQYDENKQLVGVVITQTREGSAGAGVKAESKVTGEKSELKADAGSTYVTTTTKIDMKDLSPEKQKAVHDWTKSGLIAPDLHSMAENGEKTKMALPVWDDFAQILHDDGQTLVQEYNTDSSDAKYGQDNGDKDKKLGVNLNSSTSGKDLKQAYVSKPKDANGHRDLVEYGCDG